jgi:tape measure domain-containing protein
LSTLSQNNIVVNYVLNDDQVNKAKTAYDKLTDAEKKAVDEARKLNEQLKKTGNEGQESGKKTETALLKVVGPINQNRAALSAFTSQLKVAGDAATTAATKASAGFAGVEAKQRAATAATNAFRSALISIDSKPIIKVKEASQDAAKELNGFTSIAKSGAGLLAGFFAVSQIKSFGAEVLDATIKFDTLRKAINFTSGSMEVGSANFAFLTKIANELGISLDSASRGFKTISGAASQAGYTNKQVQDIFLNTSKAIAAFGLNADEANGVFQALSQIISKGVVSMEELRQQLGERLPGVLAIAAKSVGKTTEEFVKLVSSGKITEREFIIPFTNALGLMSEKAAGIDSAGKAVTRFKNAYDQLLISLGRSADEEVGVIGWITKKATNFFNYWAEAFKTNMQKAENLVGEGYQSIVDSDIAKNKELEKADLILFKSRTERNLKLKEDELKLSNFRIGLEKALLKQAKENVSVLSPGSTGIYRDALLAVKLRKQEIISLEESVSLIKGQIKGYDELIKGKTDTKKVTKELTDEELKALKAQYDAKMQMLNLEKQERELRGKIANNPQAGLTAEIKFLEDELALKKLYQQKGLDIKDIEIVITREKLAIAEKDYDAGLMKNYNDTVNNESAKEKAKKDSMDKTLEMTKDYAKFSKEISDKSTQDEIDNIEKTARIRKDAEEAEAKYEKKKADEKNDIIQASYDLAVTTTNGLFNLQSQYAANDMVRKQKQFDEEIRLADGNQQKIDEINQKRAIAEKEYREKEFRANQAQAVANVIFQTAAIVAKWASNPVTAPLAALTLGVQAAQIAIILAQPVPEFAEGTKGKAFKGKAIVGEKGTELVTTLSGKQYYTPPTATLAQFDEPVHITPNHLLGLNDRYLSSQYFNNSGKKDSSGMQIVTKLEAIENGLKNMPVAAISLDEKGFMKKVRTPNRSTTILNNRYKN